MTAEQTRLNTVGFRAPTSMTKLAKKTNHTDAKSCDKAAAMHNTYHCFPMRDSRCEFQKNTGDAKLSSHPPDVPCGPVPQDANDHSRANAPPDYNKSRGFPTLTITNRLQGWPLSAP